MDNNWFGPFYPEEVNYNYTEANSWQYSFFVPHDIDGLIKLHNGKEKFENISYFNPFYFKDFQPNQKK